MNEAAERLRDIVRGLFEGEKILDEALAAERRATVERIRARIVAMSAAPDYTHNEAAVMGEVLASVNAILDEEAAR